MKGGMEIIGDPFITTNSKSASYAFLLSFILGCFSIYYNYYIDYIPSVLVILYCCYIFIVQNRYYISLSSETKNSAYFLGFLFNLAALFKTFTSLKSLEAVNALDIIVPQIGMALSTTICGLVGRHIIISFDPATERQESVLRCVTEELKENASAYKMAQNKLLDLINAFLADHKDLLKAEQDASKEHIKFLSESTDALKKISENYPKAANNIIDDFAKVQEKIDTILDKTLPEVQKHIIQKTGKHLEKMNNDFVESSKLLFSKMTDSVETSNEAVSSFAKRMADNVQKIPLMNDKLLEEGLTILKNTQRSFAEYFASFAKLTNEEIYKTAGNLKVFSDAFANLQVILTESIKPKLETIDDGYNNLLKQIECSNTVLDTSNSKFAKGLETLNGTMSEFQSSCNRRISDFNKEISEINSLISSFIEVTSKRMIN
jgi:hypothetical protein